MQKPVIDARNIKKYFGVVKALDGVDFQVYPNEIIGLVGENGAGKSTLMKVLLGIHKPEKGAIFLNGNKVEISNPAYANSIGIFMVFQEQSLLVNMTVYENMFLGYEDHFMKNGLIDKKKMIQESKIELNKIGVQIDPSTYVSDLPFVQRQLVEIMRNVWKAGISGAERVLVILDEPTSALGEKDAEILFEQMKNLKKFASIVFISHKLHEIVQMCDRTFVLKDGKNAGLFEKKNASEEKIRSTMLGGSIEGEYYLVDEQRIPDEKVVLEVKNLTKEGAFYDLSFKVHEGEIFCITGTLGSGKRALCDVLYGLTESDSGKIFLNNNELSIKTPINAVSLGIGLSPDDRKGKGLILGTSVSDNLNISVIKGLISNRALSKNAMQIIEKLRIVTPSEKTIMRELSGGNQQKAIIGRLILSKYKLIVFTFPTRGVDVGAKREIYSLLRELVKGGTAIILVGDSFEEDIGLSNRIMTLKDGVCTGILDANSKKPSLEEIAPFIL